ncbi:MAG: OmpH family outer membrane protein, partial [Bacteroidales bacterium]
MKKIALIFGILLAGFTMSFGQKFAYVNTEYILGRIPAYDAAQKQLDRLSEEWQKEIEGKRLEVVYDDLLPDTF